MAYIDNPFIEGQHVLCINDNFPIVESTTNKDQIGTYPTIHPKKGEVICIDEILGQFLRFDKYDCNDEDSPNYGWCWWKHTNFKPLSKKEIEEYQSSLESDLEKRDLFTCKGCKSHISTEYKGKVVEYCYLCCPETTLEECLVTPEWIDSYTSNQRVIEDEEIDF